jgi:hypothetical protein
MFSDNRAQSLIYTAPRGEEPVTAEAAGSSPVVPAILFKHLQT